MGRNKVEIKNEEYDIYSDVQTLFTETKATSKMLIIDDKLTACEFFVDVGFYDNRLRRKVRKWARMKDNTHDLPKALNNFQNPFLTMPAIENE